MDYFEEFAPNNSFNASIKIRAFMEIARASVRSACLQIIFLPLVQSRILRLMHFPTSDFRNPSDVINRGNYSPNLTS